MKCVEGLCDEHIGQKNYLWYVCEIVVQVWNEAHNHASSKNSFVLNVNTFYQLLYWIVQ